MSEKFPIDPEIVTVVKKLNAIPGVKTDNSCYGHEGREVPYISFKAKSIKGLNRVIDAVYGLRWRKAFDPKTDLWSIYFLPWIGKKRGFSIEWQHPLWPREIRERLDETGDIIMPRPGKDMDYPRAWRRLEHVLTLAARKRNPILPRLPLSYHGWQIQQVSEYPEAIKVISPEGDAGYFSQHLYPRLLRGIWLATRQTFTPQEKRRLGFMKYLRKKGKIAGNPLIPQSELDKLLAWRTAYIAGEVERLRREAESAARLERQLRASRWQRIQKARVRVRPRHNPSTRYGDEYQYRGYRIRPVFSWNAPNNKAWNVHDYAGEFVSGQYGRKKDAMREVDSIWKSQKKNPMAIGYHDWAMPNPRRRRGSSILDLVRIGIVP